MNELVSEKDLEKLKDYDRLKREYTLLHEDYRRLLGRHKKQLSIQDVSPRSLFDNGLQYYKELAEKSGNELNIDTASIIAKDYVKHVNHFLNTNVG